MAFTFSGRIGITLLTMRSCQPRLDDQMKNEEIIATKRIHKEDKIPPKSDNSDKKEFYGETVKPKKRYNDSVAHASNLK